MHQPFDTALMRHTDRRFNPPSAHERALRDERKAARRCALRAFVAQVFAHMLRHPVAPLTPSDRFTFRCDRA